MNRPFGELYNDPTANALNWGRLDVATSFDANTPSDFAGRSLDRIARGFFQQPRVTVGRSPYPRDTVDVIENPPYSGAQNVPDDGLVIDPATGKAVRVGASLPDAGGAMTAGGNTIQETLNDAGKRIGLTVVALIIGAIALVMILK